MVINDCQAGAAGELITELACYHTVIIFPLILEKCGIKTKKWLCLDDLLQTFSAQIFAIRGAFVEASNLRA